MNETLQIMLKTTILFLFGCSLYYGQSVATAPSNNQANTTACTNCPPDLNKDTDGTRVKNTDGGNGSGNGMPDLIVVPVGNDLRVSLSKPGVRFIRYFMFNTSDIEVKNQIVAATNSYSVDISGFNPGHYYLTVELESHHYLTKSFFKP